MVINDKNIKITVQYPTLKYWKSKGYVCDVGHVIYVPLEHIQKKSNIMIDCICNLCSRKYTQRRSRDLEVCGYCKLSNRMKGNTIGSVNKKYLSPGKKILEDLVFNQQYGKNHLAKKFGVTIPVIERWLKDNNIKLRPYHGRKFFSSEENRIQVTNQFKEIIKNDSQKTLAEISKEMNIPRHILASIAKQENIVVANIFSTWNDQYDSVMNNMLFYIEENKTKTLKDIADQENISIEHLKKAFNETNTPVRAHSYNKSAGELEVRDFIRSFGLDCFSFKFHKIYEIDCYAKTKNFGVEYCGEYWHRYVPAKNNKYYHRNKREFMESKNINIMTIFESEWKSNKELIKSMISSKLGMTDKIYARKCESRIIAKKDADAFHKVNHISKSSVSSINIGLFYKNDLVSVLSFVKSRFDKNFEYEISRYSTKMNMTVVGGFSKMFSLFVKTYNPSNCMTYADLRFGTGNVYLQAGFVPMGKTAPNYHYFNCKIGYLENRMKYQKSMLGAMPGYAPDKTEFEIMTDSGYWRLYDCGNNRYGWQKGC